MRLLIYNIQDPLDPQVNGFGFYRSIPSDDGVATTPLLIARKHIGGRSRNFPSVEFSITHPWEASDCSDEELVPVWTHPTQYTIGTDSSPTAATSSNTWEIDPILHANNADTYRCTQPWEIEMFDVDQPGMTWAFSTTTEDDGLGAEVEYDNDPPPGNHLIAPFQEHLFVAGDPDNPHLLYFSKRFKPESYPTDNYLEIGTAHDPLTALVPLAGLLGVFTRDTKYRLSGNATTGFTHYEAISRRGTSATKSVVPTDKGIIFVAHDGVFTTNLIGPDTKLSGKIESLFTGDEVSDEEAINHDALDQVAAAYFKSKYYFVYPSASSTTPDRFAVYSFDTEEWAIWDLAGGSLLYESETDVLTLGGADGFVYQLESGTTDSGEAIEGSFWTKEFQGGSYNVNNLFLYLKIDCRVGNGSTLTVDLYVDGESAHTFTLTDTGGRQNTLNNLPENTFGTRWQVRATFSDDAGETKIYGVAMIGIPLQAS